MKPDCHLILFVVVAKIHASLFLYKRDPSCIDDFLFLDSVRGCRVKSGTIRPVL
jgi:hypothetical protein